MVELTITNIEDGRQLVYYFHDEVDALCAMDYIQSRTNRWKASHRWIEVYPSAESFKEYFNRELPNLETFEKFYNQEAKSRK